MSEWRATVDPCKSAREYVPGLLVGHAVPKHGAQWVWYFFDEHALRGEPDGEAPTEADAHDACDAAAVAWVLIALAKRAAAWARDVDAELARCYRAANARYDVARTAYVESFGGSDELCAYNAAGREADEAHDALMRGWR